jgi:hypothetical protein
MTIKTLFLFNSPYERPFFFEKEGDFSHLEGTYLQSTENEDKQTELNNLMYDQTCDQIFEKLDKPTKDWTYFVVVGMLL